MARKGQEISWLIKREKIENLKFYDKNPRKFTDKGLKDLKRSIIENGDANIITANADNTVLGGHARLTVMKDLGIKEVDVKYPSEQLDDKKVQEIVIRLNANTAGEWDLDKLQADFDLDELGDWGLDLDFTQLEDDKEIIEDEVPEEVETRCKLGDIWQLGNHRLMCGDSTVITDVEKLMDGQRADMVFTDPPYGVSYTGGLQNTQNGLAGNNRQMIKNDDVDLYEAAVLTASIFCTGVVFMFYADTVPFGLYRGIENVGGEVVALIIWKKQGGYGALGASYKQNHEPCVIWKLKKNKLNFIGSTSENRVWEEKKDGLNKLHPTQKPVSIPARAIGNHKAKTVLDLFGGSGSTLIACEQLDRHARLMEIDPHYCDVIITRWENFTGKQAELING